MANEEPTTEAVLRKAFWLACVEIGRCHKLANRWRRAKCSRPEYWCKEYVREAKEALEKGR